ncbi:MAG: hypothetical protein EXR83_06900 [Gammaproteobacteria bacterium]|nr:hypothetical protein [Gammaproteobacteria bacterium]
MFYRQALSCLLLVLGLGVLLKPVAALSAEPATGERRALAKAQALLKTLNTQKVAAETELASVKLQCEDQAIKRGKLDAAFKAQQAALKLATTSLEAASRQSKALSSALERNQKRLAHSNEQLPQLTARLRETTSTLQEAEAKRVALARDLDANRTELKDAESKNLALYQANQALLDEFADEGTFKRLFRGEPFTGVRQVQIENLRQEYAGKLTDQLRDSNRATVGEP